MKELIIKSYSNGSFAYYSETIKTYVNIPSELAKYLKELNLPPEKIKFTK